MSWARSASGAAVSRLGGELRRAASVAVDSKFLSLIAATSGITSAGSSGITAANVLSDLTGRLNALTIGADSRLWFIVGPKVYKTLQLLQGTGGYLVQNGAIGPIRLAASDAASTVGTLSDTPSSGEQTGVSLWQANMTGLKVEVAFGAVAMRSTSVTTITGYAA